MWGLRRLGVKGKISKAIPGGSRLWTINTPKASGYVKENRLDYMLKALPSGWAGIVERTAGNMIMEQARRKLEAKWRREMGMPKFKKGMTKASARGLSQYFIKGLT